MKIDEYRNPLTRDSYIPCSHALKGRPFVIFDTETTGLGSDDEIVEAAVLNAYGDEIYHSMYKPEKQIDPQASVKTGIYNADLEDAPLFRDEYGKLLKVMNGMVVVGHNVSYDIKMLKQTASRYGLDIRPIEDLALSTFDTCSNARKQIRSENYRLETLYRSITGDTEEQKHRATYDCLWTLVLLRYMDSNWKDLSKVKKGSIEDARPMILAKRPAAEIAAALNLSTYTIEKYIVEMAKEGQVKQSDFMDRSEAETIYKAAVSMPDDWDGKMKPLKEALPENITYLMINLMYAGAAFKPQVIAVRAKRGLPAPAMWR